MPALLQPDVSATPSREGGSGALYLRSNTPLITPMGHLGLALERGAEQWPDRDLFLMRGPDGALVRRSWAEVSSRAQGIAAALIRRGTSRPVAVLSGNSIRHAELSLGAMLAGVAVAPVSVAYSTRSTTYARLSEVLRVLDPALCFVEERAAFEQALALDALRDVEVIDGAALDALADGPPDRHAIEAANVGPDTIAKILFTSGSTGRPKGVITTQRMLCANQQMLGQVWPFLHEQPPVLVDWLPWSHTFGGSYNFNMVLVYGGTLLIDEGRPAPALFDKTVANLLELPPTDYFTVPAGYAALVPRLEEDADLRAAFFQRLRTIFYAGAALPDDLWQRLSKLAEAQGAEVFMTTAWGSTETSPMSTSAHFQMERAGNIGVPVPGAEIKLVPVNDSHEIRVRGPHVFPGYLGDEELSRAAFDEEGFYRIGDAVRLADPANPAAGLLFDGRVAENFKLITGTWVSASTLRTRLLEACSPALLDVVVCGHDRDRIGILAWPSPAGVDRLGDGLAAYVRERVATFTAQNPSSSTAVRRLMLLDTPPNIDAGEITDKGYINQRAVRENRAAEVEALLARAPGSNVLTIEP